MTTPARGGLAAPPAQDVPALAAACKDRILEREGIPMFVALHDARPGRYLRVDDPATREDASYLVALFDHYRNGLSAGGPLHETPGELEVEGDAAEAGAADLDPTGAAALIDVLVVLSDQHLRARSETQA